MTDENLFTDAQVERIKELIQDGCRSEEQIEWTRRIARDEGNIQLGKAAFKIIFLAIGTMVSGAIAGFLAYLGVKH